MARVAWTMIDNSTGVTETLQFEINPNEFEPPGRRARITTMNTTAPSGTRIFFGGADEVSQGQIRGAVNSASFKAALDTWFSKWWPLTITDDLGNSWDILIEDVSWTRLNRYLYPHRYDYTMRFMSLS